MLLFCPFKRPDLLAPFIQDQRELIKLGFVLAFQLLQLVLVLLQHVLLLLRDSLLALQLGLSQLRLLLEQVLPEPFALFLLHP